jgi:soluble lytic murein transglycosylase-like protein
VLTYKPTRLGNLRFRLGQRATQMSTRITPFAVYKSSALVSLGFLLSSLSFTALAQPVAIFTSTDSKGHTRWATQAWDTSYQQIPNLSLVDAAPSHSLSSPTSNTSRNSAIAKRRQQWQSLINSVANRHGIDARWVAALIEIESGFNPKAVSPKGAIGLMQLMPATAARYGVRNARELFDPERNLDIGVRHLKDLLIAHEGNVALAMASYNAGSGAVAKHGKRIPRFNETMLYVPAVLAAIASYPPAEKP